MNNAMRMMAISRSRGNGGNGQMNDRSGEGGEMRYENAARYEGGNGEYENRRRYRRMESAQDERGYQQNYNGGERGETSRRNRRENGEEWPKENERPMDTYSPSGRSEGRMNTIGFGGKVDMVQFPKKGHGRMNNQRLDKQTAEEWVENMENSDGTKGEHWSLEKTEELRQQKGIQCDPVEFWAAMNAAYSDLGKMARKHNLGIDFWVDYVKAFWFEDADAGPNKLAMYHECFGGM